MSYDKDTETQHDKKETGSQESSDPIETPEEVPASNDEKIDQDFPGYPHYPAEEDLLNPDNNNGRVDADVENLTRAHKVPQENLNEGPSVTPSNAEMVIPAAEDDNEDDIGIVAGTEADVTDEDLLILGPKDRDMDMDEDEEVLNKAWPLEATGEDLDVPGSEIDDDNEAIGEEDEENNYYSIGGDNHENLEEDNKNSY